MSALEPLLTLQERDLALDRIRHRLVRAARARRRSRRPRRASPSCRRPATHSARSATTSHARRSAHEDEANSLGQQAAEAEAKLYSGEISSPRELQALQADIEQLKRHQQQVEDRQLAVDGAARAARRAARRARRATPRALDGELATQRDALAAAEGDARRASSRPSRPRVTEVAAGIDDDLLEMYEQCREKANGVGAARLVGTTCQGCHLSIPATEVDRVKKAPPGTVEHCDNCGTILVP